MEAVLNDRDDPREKGAEPFVGYSSSALPSLRKALRDPKYAASLVEAVAHSEVLSSAFQPIFRARTGELEGCEALARLPEGSGLDGPYEAFRVAIRSNMLHTLQSAAIIRHLSDVRPFLRDHRLFLNVVAPLFADESFGVSWLKDQVLAAGIKPGQVVLELPEIQRVLDMSRFAKHIEPFRWEGFRVAIDDFGVGYTNLREIVELAPDFVKIDRVFVEKIASHVRKRALVESVTMLCHRIGCEVVAEGVETAGELETCLEADVDYVQGFLFARPSLASEAFSAAPLRLPARPL